MISWLKSNKVNLKIYSSRSALLITWIFIGTLKLENVKVLPSFNTVTLKMQRWQ